MSLTPENGGLYGWRNAATVPSTFRLLPYRPLNRVNRIPSTTPILLIAAENDTLCPAQYVERAARLLGRSSEVLVMPGAQHFDVYRGETHRKTVQATVDFLQSKLQK